MRIVITLDKFTQMLDFLNFLGCPENMTFEDLKAMQELIKNHFKRG